MSKPKPVPTPKPVKEQKWEPYVPPVLGTTMNLQTFMDSMQREAETK